jgi:ABC-type Na+ transport system ATPase subunit NatA
MLNLTGISKTYPGGVHALQDIHLDVPRGMFGLLGLNGAGKSTLMRTIATLQQPDCESIKFNGIDVLQDKTALRRTLGYLPQEFGAYPRTSALAMLKHLAALKGIHGGQQRQVVENLLVKTNLWDARNKSVDKFSGGMKQRYGIAQALLGNPALLIVKEYYPSIYANRIARGMLDGYLKRRRNENEAELPLMYAENQGYISYLKGPLALYALQDIIGKEKVHQGLRNFLNDYSFQTSPCPTSRDLVNALRRGGPGISTTHHRFVREDRALRSASGRGQRPRD